MKLEALINIYKEQAKYLLEAGVDLFVVETMMSLAETRAAVIAIKEVCNLPVIASLTFQEDGRTLYGTDPVTAVVVLQSIGADIKFDCEDIDTINGYLIYKLGKIPDENDVTGYAAYPVTECPLCKQGQKIEAMVNGFGYSKL